MWIATASMFSITASSAVALGQVNTEKLRSWRKPGYGGHIDGSVSWRTGNVEQLELGAGLRAQYARFAAKTSTAGPSEPPVDLVYLVGNLVVGVQGSDRFKNAGFLHMRYTRHFVPWWAAEAFAQAQYNEFVRLTQRQLVGVGARLEALRGGSVEIVTATGLMLEYERQNVPDDGPDARDMLSIRSTSYVALKIYSDVPKVTAVNTLYVQPRLDVPADIRVLNEAELAVAVLEHIHFAFSFSLRFDSRPVTGIDRLDTHLVNKLRMTF